MLPFVSHRRQPTLSSLPPEVLSRIAFHLSLGDYSHLSRTCSDLHGHLFHPSEIVLFLKTRYRLSIESGSIIIFAYLANMQIRAPLVLERIFNDFFADSEHFVQEEQQRKLQLEHQRQIQNSNTFMLNRAISGNLPSESECNYHLQRIENVLSHKSAEEARRQAKWDAVRMLGVLYALDKTHVGPSSSTNALVLSGASDITLPPVEAPPIHKQPKVPELFPITSSPPDLVHASSPGVDSAMDVTMSSDSRQSRFSRKGAGVGPSVVTTFQQPIRRSLSHDRSETRIIPKSVPLDNDPLRYFIQRRSQRKRMSPLLSGKERSLTGGFWTDPAASFPDDSFWASSSYPFSFSSSSPSPLSWLPICGSDPSCALAPNKDHPLRQGSRHGKQKAGVSPQPLRGFTSRRFSGQQDKAADMTNESSYNTFISSEGEPMIPMESYNGRTRGHHSADGFHPFSTGVDSFQSSSSYKPFEDNLGGEGVETNNADQEMDNWPFMSTVERNTRESRLPMGRSHSPVFGQTQTFSPPAPRIIEKRMPSKNTSQNILNRDDKIAFLTKYTDRMHLKLQALGIKDWGQEDIQRKKTYQLMIQQNDKSGEKDLVEFYLGRYGGSVHRSEPPDHASIPTP